MRLITKGQIKLIHTLKNQARIKEDDYRDLLKSKFNRNSCLELTEAQASVCCNLLKNWTKDFVNYKQKEKIKKLCEEVKIKDIKEFIKQHIKYDICINNLTKKEASKLIFILEKIKRWKNEGNNRKN